jgi:hypothetical protein
MYNTVMKVLLTIDNIDACSDVIYSWVYNLKSLSFLYVSLWSLYFP